MIKTTLITILLTITSLQAIDTQDERRSAEARILINDAKVYSKPITPKKFHEMIEKEEVDFIQLDVRENNQYGHGEIWTADKVDLTRGYIEYKVEYEIKNKKTKIIVVCCSGSRALLASKTLKKLGYKDVLYLEGGVNGWLEAGYPLDTVFGELYLKKD